MKTILVGEAPPQWRPKDTPTSLPFSGASGKRFSDMLGVDVTEAFETRNLLAVWPGKDKKGSLFPLPLARVGARWLVRELEERYLRDMGHNPRLLLCGTRVQAAFRLRDLPQLEWFAIMLPGSALVTFNIAIIPHPSGVNRAWNDPIKTEEVKRFLVDEYHRSQ